jgi:hypothetical protein
MSLIIVPRVLCGTSVLSKDRLKERGGSGRGMLTLSDVNYWSYYLLQTQGVYGRL